MTTATTKTIDSRGIATLLDYKDPQYAYHAQRLDPTFPRALKSASALEIRHALWALDDVLAWQKTRKRVRQYAGDRYPQLDNKMAQQIIRRGWKRGSRAIAQAEKTSLSLK